MTQKFEIDEKDYRTAVTNLAVAEARGQEITRLHSLLVSITGKETGGVTQEAHAYVIEKNKELGATLNGEREKLKNSESTLKLLGETNLDLKAKCEAIRFLDEVCDILNREHPKRPVTYDEVARIVEVNVAHRDSARDRNGVLVEEVKKLKEASTLRVLDETTLEALRSRNETQKDLLDGHDKRNDRLQAQTKTLQQTVDVGYGIIAELRRDLDLLKKSSKMMFRNGEALREIATVILDDVMRGYGDKMPAEGTIHARLYAILKVMENAGYQSARKKTKKTGRKKKTPVDSD